MSSDFVLGQDRGVPLSAKDRESAVAAAKAWLGNPDHKKALEFRFDCEETLADASLHGTNEPFLNNLTTGHVQRSHDVCFSEEAFLGRRFQDPKEFSFYRKRNYLIDFESEGRILEESRTGVFSDPKLGDFDISLIKGEKLDVLLSKGDPPYLIVLRAEQTSRLQQPWLLDGLLVDQTRNIDMILELLQGDELSSVEVDGRQCLAGKTVTNYGTVEYTCSPTLGYVFLDYYLQAKNGTTRMNVTSMSEDMTEFVVRLRSSYPSDDGTSIRTTDAKYRIYSVVKGHDRIKFCQPEIEFGTEVRVMQMEQIPHQWQDGKVVRTVEGAKLQKLRKTPPPVGRKGGDNHH